MVTPVGKRDAVAHACKKHGVSQLRACAILQVDRSSIRYKSIRGDDADLREAMKKVAAKRDGQPLSDRLFRAGLRET